MPQGAPPPFVKKTYELVSDETTNQIVSWSDLGDSFVIWQPHVLQTEILPKYFKHNNLCSFVRQLNTYDFRKIVDQDNTKGEELEFKNDNFIRDQPELLQNISRKKPGKRTATQRDVSDIILNNINSSDPLRTFTNEEINTIATTCLIPPNGNKNSVDELKNLMSDNNAMINAIVALSEKQQHAENMLTAVTKELAEAKKLISVLTQERALTNPSEGSFLDKELSATSLQFLDKKPICNPIFGNVSIPSRTEVAEVAQERRKSQLYGNQEPEPLNMTPWSL